MTRLWPGLSALFLCSLTIGSTRTVPTSQEMVEPPQGPTDETTQPIPLSHVLQKDGGNTNERPNKYLEYQLKSREFNFAATRKRKLDAAPYAKVTKLTKTRPRKYKSSLNRSYRKIMKEVQSWSKQISPRPINKAITNRVNQTAAKEGQPRASVCYYRTPDSAISQNISLSAVKHRQKSLTAKTEKSDRKLISTCEKSSQITEVKDSRDFQESCISSLSLLEQNFDSGFDSINDSAIFNEVPDNCTYFETTDTVLCDFSTDIPNFNETEEVDYLVFRYCKIKVLEDSDAFNLPNSKTLAFMDGDVMRISPGFLQKCQSEELIVHNNHLSSWSFSWFYAGDKNLHSNMTSIDLSNNLIHMSVSKANGHSK